MRAHPALDRVVVQTMVKCAVAVGTVPSTATARATHTAVALILRPVPLLKSAGVATSMNNG